MSMDLAKQTFRLDEEYFIAGANIPITTAVKPAGAALEAHTPVLLGTDGKVTAAADKTKLSGLYGITAETAGKDEDAIIYLTGEFFKTALVLAEGLTADDFEVALRNIGIFLK